MSRIKSVSRTSVYFNDSSPIRKKQMKNPQTGLYLGAGSVTQIYCLDIAGKHISTSGSNLSSSLLVQTGQLMVAS